MVEVGDLNLKSKFLSFYLYDTKCAVIYAGGKKLENNTMPISP